MTDKVERFDQEGDYCGSLCNMYARDDGDYVKSEAYDTLASHAQNCDMAVVLAQEWIAEKDARIKELEEVNSDMWSVAHGLIRITNLRENYAAAKEAIKPPWIDIAERLPETSGEYFVLTSGERPRCFDYSVKYNYWESESGEIKNNVTHWMPIPPRGKS